MISIFIIARGFGDLNHKKLVCILIWLINTIEKLKKIDVKRFNYFKLFDPH